MAHYAGGKLTSPHAPTDRPKWWGHAPLLVASSTSSGACYVPILIGTLSSTAQRADQYRSLPQSEGVGHCFKDKEE